MRLALEDLIALSFAQDMARPLSDSWLGQALAQLSRRIRSTLSPEAARILDEAKGSVAGRVTAGRDYGAHAAVLRALGTAVQRRKV